MNHTFAIAVFACGLGTRIGGNKPSRLLAGRPLADHVKDRVSRWRAPLWELVRQAGQGGLGGSEEICDASPPGVVLEGPLAGLYPALLRAEAEGRDLLTVPVDMPFLPDDLPGRLGAALVGERGPVCAMAQSQGRPHPVCTLWRGPVSGLIAEQAFAGNFSLKALAARAGVRHVIWTQAPDPFFNINTPEELAEAQVLLAAADRKVS